MSAAPESRHLGRTDLVRSLREARVHTLAAVLDLSNEQWMVPYHPGIQPVAWDLAHIGWFAEFWLLRAPHRIGSDGTVHADGTARVFGHDGRYDSSRIGHRERWQMPLYERGELLDLLSAQLEACCEAITHGGDSDADLYHARFALFHEMMHHEALLWTRALLDYPAPHGVVMARVGDVADVQHGGGEHWLGSAPGAAGFAFDNERPGRRVVLSAFAIDASPVTNARFLPFVEEQGYDRAEFWPGQAAAFRASIDRRHPERWRRASDGSFEQRWFGEHRALVGEEPVIHITAYEAEAFCRYARRRLPTAAEWEVAAPRMTWGKTVWEWTADAFAPYPGFRPGPYTTYSAPWFHRQREMRGGAFATNPTMHDRAYRNFFLPQRTDVFAGFRTAAL